MKKLALFTRYRLYGALSPSTLFAGGVAGAWYDPSDLNNYMAGLGPELVTNGDFSAGTTGWSSTGSSVLSVTSGALRVENGAAVTGGTTQTINTIAGRWYTFTYYVNPATAGSVTVRVRDAVSLTVLQSVSQTVAGTYTYTFAAIGSTTQVQSINGASTLGVYHEIDSISVKEVTSIGSATMFTDSAGTTPVTAVEQQVGLILDKSQGLVLGPELVTNPGPFTSTTGYSPNNATLAVVSGEIEVTATASTGYVDFNFTAVAGTWYRVQITAYVSSGSLQYRLSIPGAFDTAFKTNTTAATTTCYVLASGASLAIRAGFSGTIGDKYRIVAESAKALPGNHAFQSTNTAFRPTLRSRLNLLTYSEQFDNAAWTKQNTFVQTNLLTYSTLAGAVAGTPGTAGTDWGIVSTGGNLTNVTADTAGNNILTFASSAARVYFTRAYAVAANTTYTYSATINSNTGILFYECIYILSLPAGATMTFFANGVSVDALTYVPVANDRLSVVLAVAGTSGTVNVRIGAGVGGSVTGTVAISRPQLVQGSVPGDYRATYATALPILYTSPIGTLTANKLVSTEINSTHYVNESITLVASTNYSASVYLKAAGYGWAIVYIGTVGVGRYINLSTGAVGSAFIAAPTSTTVTDAGNGWWRVTVVFNSGANTLGDIRVYQTTADATSSYLGDGTSGIYIWGAQLVGGTTAQNYQRITTATDYDTAGFPLYLFCDGSNDTMQSNTITFSTKYMTCVTGDSRTNNAAQRILLELSADSSVNNGSFGVFSPFATNGSYGWQRDNTVTSDNITTAGYTALTPYVGTGIIDFTANTEASFTVDTSYNVSALDTGASNFGNYPIYIGARAGTSLFFSGNIYQILFVNKLLSASELVNLQYFVATKCGIAAPGTVPTTGAFYQTGPTLDLVFAGVPTDGIPGSGDSLMLDFTSPTYQVGSPYMVWEE